MAAKAASSRHRVFVVMSLDSSCARAAVWLGFLPCESQNVTRCDALREYTVQGRVRLGTGGGLLRIRRACHTRRGPNLPARQGSAAVRTTLYGTRTGTS